MSIKGFSVGGNVERYDYNFLDNLPSEITIDTALSDSSTNPVQNRVVTSAINSANGSISSISGEVDDLKSALDDTRSRVFKSETTTDAASIVLDAGQFIRAETPVLYFRVPANIPFTYKVEYGAGISKVSGVYKTDINGQRSVIKYSPVNGQEYIATFDTETAFFSLFVDSPNVTAKTTVTLTVSYSIENENSLEAKVDDFESIADGFEADVVDADDLEVGAILNGAGTLFDDVNRARTKGYIPLTQGTVVTSGIQFNLWEYDQSTHEYIRDNGAWTNSYTVTQDCVAKIMWKRNRSTNVYWTNAEIISKSNIPVAPTIKPISMNADDVMGVIRNDVNELTFENQPSVTVKTIAHRGDDIDGPQCTAPAYILARKHGLKFAENDLWLSEDGEFVMWHDTTLGRLGNLVDLNGYLMYTDGTNYYWVKPSDSSVWTWDGTDYVASSVALSGLTRCAGADYGVNSTYATHGLNFDVLRRIDFGAYKGSQFAGTQILTFDEWVLLCKQLGMEIRVDGKMSYTNELLTRAANIVKKYGMGDCADWLSVGKNRISLLRSIIPDARVGILEHPSSSLVSEYAQYNTGRGFFFNGDAKTGMTAEAIQLGLNAGFDVEVWFVDTTTYTKEQILQTIRTAVSYGVTGITLDHYRAEDAFEYLLEQY